MNEGLVRDELVSIEREGVVCTREVHDVVLLVEFVLNPVIDEMEAGVVLVERFFLLAGRDDDPGSKEEEDTDKGGDILVVFHINRMDLQRKCILKIHFLQTLG